MISGGVDIEAAKAAATPAADLSVLMAGAMHCSLQQRGLAPPSDYTKLATAAQIANYLKQAQQISKAAAGAR